VTTLARSNAPVKVVQELARQSDPRLTMNLYTSTVSGREATELVFVGDLASFTVPGIFWESSTWLKESMPPLTWESLSPSVRTDDAPCSKGSIALPKAFLITYNK
jgi:hypothetical protein